jgi:2-phosphosulfolactate phosphatase
MRVEVAFSPPATPPVGRTCLVVDVLRATSVLAVLFGRGAHAVYPVATVEQGRALRERIDTDGGPRPLLCGEVEAQPPPGYDLGNSPSEFARLEPAPQRAIVATTNGTPALLACAAAPLVAAAAPLNAGAAVRLALEAGRDVLVVCAGHPRGLAEDDVLAAGLIASRLVEAGGEPDAPALEAIARYEGACADLAAALRATHHGETLVRLGFGEDVDFCARTDRYERVAVLGAEGGRAVLRPAEEAH